MYPPQHPKITQAYKHGPQGSPLRVTRLEQELDNTHVVIESTTPATSSRQQGRSSNSREKAKYYIEIDDDDDSNIDVIVNVGQSPQIRSNRRYQTGVSEVIRRDDTTNTYNTNSRIRIQSHPNNDYDYEINYSTQNHNNRHQKSHTSNLEKDYQTCITETQHTIKIKSNNQPSSSYIPQSIHQMHKERNPTHSHQFAQSSYPVPKQREQKSFGIHTSEMKNLQGKIIKNRESNKNITETGVNDKQKIYQSNKRQADVSQKSQAKTKKQDRNDTQTSMQRIKLLDGQQAGKPSTNRYTIDTSGKKIEVSNTRQFRTQPRTPKNNYQNASDQSLSPIVQEYGHSPEFNYMDENLNDEVFYGDTKKNPTQFENIDLPREDSLDKQRPPPVPYGKKSTIQKQIQRQISSEWPPSLKDIPNSNQTKLKKNNVGVKTARGDHSRHSPIIVPIEKQPHSPEKQQRIMEENVASANRQIKRVRIFLNSRPHQGHIHKQIVKSRQQDGKNDVFVVNKQKYLDKLRKSELSKSKLENSRTFSRTSRHSLSPECERITNRLHKTVINKQPCPKYMHYKELMKRSEMKETLGQYSFIRRYLTDTEIEQILTQLELQGVPQKKWPMRLVDIVYDKLRAIKVY